MSIDSLAFKMEIETLLDPLQIKSIALAVSGGADSMCMAYLCHTWATVYKINITCIIIDHKLREESSSEAKFVKQLLHQKGINAQILSWDTPKPSSNIHAIARTKRYDFLTEYCKKHHIQYLFTAHNKDDQAETVLLRIMRGTGIDGLASIQKKSQLNGINIIRPLLTFSRKEIVNTLQHIDWQWVIDPSNFNKKYDRTKIRNLLNILPNKELTISRLNLLANNARRAKNFLENYTTHTYNSIISEGTFGELSLNRTQFLTLDDEIAFRLLTKILKIISGNHYPPRLESIELLHSTIKNQLIFTKTLWGAEIKSEGRFLIFYREFKAVEQIKQLNQNQETCWDNRYLLTTAQQDLYIGALGVQGLKTLKSWDTQQYKLNAKIMYSTPGIFQNNQLIFFPMLNIGVKPLKIFNFRRKQKNEIQRIDLL